jgi:hypothetical protein
MKTDAKLQLPLPKTKYHEAIVKLILLQEIKLNHIILYDKLAHESNRPRINDVQKRRNCKETIKIK